MLRVGRNDKQEMFGWSSSGRIDIPSVNPPQISGHLISAFDGISPGRPFRPDYARRRQTQAHDFRWLWEADR
jgi:hypothetical protein